jgi:RNase H-fold protein (predicted Holliday junction resolvase)
MIDISHQGMRVALDPGTFKCGWAIECQPQHSPLIGLVHIDNLETFLRQVSRFFAARQVVIGGGTGSRPVTELARQVFAPATVAVVDESGSTEEALELYLRHRGTTRPGRFIRLLGHYALKPPMDGYAAWVLLRRSAAPEEGYAETGLP